MTIPVQNTRTFYIIFFNYSVVLKHENYSDAYLYLYLYWFVCIMRFKDFQKTFHVRLTYFLGYFFRKITFLFILNEDKLDLVSHSRLYKVFHNSENAQSEVRFLSKSFIYRFPQFDIKSF